MPRLSHHTDGAFTTGTPGGRPFAPSPPNRTPFKNVGDPRQQAHSFGNQGHSGGQGHDRATSDGTGRTGKGAPVSGRRSGSNVSY